jgi:hypothetical protein
MHKLLIVCCLLFGLPFIANAKGVVKKPIKKPVFSVGVVKIAPNVDSLRLDTSKIAIHSFNADSLNKYRNNPHFIYDVDAKKVGLTWWQRLWKWFWDLIAKLFGGGDSAAPALGLFKYFVWAIALGMVVFIIIKLTGTNIFSRKSKEIEIPYSESLENIHEITFDEEIEKATSNRNYRLAVRLLYLRTLKQLNDAQLIQWQLGKTNLAYLNELQDQTQKQSFGILTRQFEYVWYGDFSVDGQSYQNINILFHDFKMMLK